VKPEPIIVADGLTRRFGDRVAVDRVSIGIEDREILGLLGPNGAGKTTLIRMWTGIIAPSSGRASVAGMDPAEEPERLHEVVGLLTEAPGFYDRLSAERNLAYFAGFYPLRDAKQSVSDALARMGLTPRRRDRVGTFSRGMKQRLALARALVHEPRILFLDEPTAGLDPEAARALRREILDLRGDGRTIVLSTHNLTEAEALCGRVAVLRTRIIAVGEPKRLREASARPAVRLRIRHPGAEGLEAIRRLPFVRAADWDRAGDGGWIVDLTDAEADRPALAAAVIERGGELLEISEVRRTLEEVYLDLVQEGGG